MNEIVGIGALNHFEQELALQQFSSCCAQYVSDLAANMFLTSKFSYLTFQPQPIQVKLGLQIAGRLPAM
jgi:hypothetical protein